MRWSPFGEQTRVVSRERPSAKRLWHKIDHEAQTVTFQERQSARVFEATIRDYFSKDKSPSWPHDGPLFLAISITLPFEDFQAKDLDNLVKSIVDAFKGLAYADDRQVVALFAHKAKGEEYGFVVGVRCLPTGDKGWYVPEHYREEPYPGQTAGGA